MNAIKKTIFAIAMVIAVLIVFFLAGRFGWKLAKFRLCNDDVIISAVNVAEGKVRISGEQAGSFPAGFCGYYAEESAGKLYIGFRFSSVFGIFDPGSFALSIPLKAPVDQIILKSAGNERIIWSTAESENTPSEPESTPAEPESTPAEPESTPAEPESTPTEPESTPTEPETAMPKAYAEIIANYYTALSEGWDPFQLMDAGLNYMASENFIEAPLENTGYAVNDIDADGREELIIGSLTQDEFYGKMILALYIMDDNGAAQLLFDSLERDRYYYAGGYHFANNGSSGWDSGFDTTLKLEEGEMIDMTFTTPSEAYVQMELTPFAQWGAQE